MSFLYKLLLITIISFIPLFAADDDLELEGILHSVDVKTSTIKVDIKGKIHTITIEPETEIDYDSECVLDGKTPKDTWGMDEKIEKFIGTRVEIELYDYPKVYDTFIAKELEIECDDD